ncbi:MAG TPA: hypothetical protein PLI09_17090 [Candidatus Hydrogenedentes bacterium]|nr:hypothetical protein [Candidatus Hydrogenedentota bacterium]
MQVVRISRSGIAEYFIHITNISVEQAAQHFLKVMQFLQAQNAAPASVTAFGPRPEAILEAAFKKISPSASWVISNNNSISLQIWAIEGCALTPIESEGNIFGWTFEDANARYCRLEGILPQHLSAPRSVQALETFDCMNAALGRIGMTFHHVVRTWLFIDHILDWYGEFNQARHDFFHRRQIFDGLVPASTGVAGENLANAALQAGLLAIQPKNGSVRAEAVPSPLQCPALEYGSAFSRAVEVQAPDHRRLMISGTASIALEGHTCHLDDLNGQIKCTYDVLHAILASRGMDWPDVCRAILYFKLPDGLPRSLAIHAQWGLPLLPAAFAEFDICRGDLLFEVELDAIKTR